MRHSLPVEDLRRNQWRQADHAQRIAEQLAFLCYDLRLPNLDPVTRAQLMQLAEDTVRTAVDEHALADVVPIDAMQAWKARIEA